MVSWRRSASVAAGADADWFARYSGFATWLRVAVPIEIPHSAQNLASAELM
jgi:hypothetical protein